MQLRNVIRRGAVITAIALAAIWFAPAATARSHVHVGVGINLPGLSIGVGNCWHCGYWSAPRVYAAPPYAGYGYYGSAYPAPVYYLDPPYYMTRPALVPYGYYGGYYGGYQDGYYGGYSPYYRSYRYGDGYYGNHGWRGHRGDDHHGGHDHQGGYYHRGH